MWWECLYEWCILLLLDLNCEEVEDMFDVDEFRLDVMLLSSEKIIVDESDIGKLWVGVDIGVG